MSRTLVIGASGFLGSHVTESLRATGSDVTGTSRSAGKGLSYCDLLDPKSLTGVIDRHRPAVIVNAAGSPSVRESWRRPADNFAVNTSGPFNLLEAARQAAPGVHLILLSSAAVYGAATSAAQSPLRENCGVNPTSPYGAAKAAAETLAAQYARQHGLAVTVLRLFNQIGAGQAKVHAPADFAGQIAAAEKSGRERVVLEVGNPEAIRDFTDVRDCAAAIALVAGCRGTGTFNLCSGEPTALSTLIAGLGRAAEVDIETTRRPRLAHPGDIDAIYGSADELTEAVGWQPRVGLQQSLEALLEDWRGRT